jgi:hypothetical protein
MTIERASAIAPTLRLGRFFLVLLLAASGCPAQADSPLPPRRDGAWLQNGIERHDTAVTSYICAVLDLEKYLAQRAAMLSGAVTDGKKKKHLDPRLLDGMTRALPLIVPLLQTRFLAANPSCAGTLVTVQDYLQKYPEMLDKDADVIVEKALLDAYTDYHDPP